MSRAESLWRRMAQDQDGPWWLTPARGAARAASWLYAAGAWADRAGHDLGWKPTERLPVPVVGVGGLAMGGTGKTPLTMAVARGLLDLGLPVGIISRGYGRQGADRPCLVSAGQGPLVGPDLAGDEPYLMARRLPVPVAVASRRAEAGRVLLAQCGPRVLVGDDMFQHHDLARDLDLVALDAAHPLGNGAVLPRGVLREDPRALERAHAVVLTRCPDAATAQAAREVLTPILGPEKPILTTRHVITGLEDFSGAALDPGRWRGVRVLAFCGLAHPDQFAAGLTDLGLEVAGLVGLGDHVAADPDRLATLAQRAAEMGAAALVCSQKDRVKLAAPPEGVALWTTRLELEFVESAEAWRALLAWGVGRWLKKA